MRRIIIGAFVCLGACQDTRGGGGGEVRVDTLASGTVRVVNEPRDPELLPEGWQDELDVEYIVVF